MNEMFERTMERSFCQSCAMPLSDPADLGTNSDGTRNKDYCRHCFQGGRFLEPDITVDQMIDRCAGIMRRMNMPESLIEETKKFIPLLKRWRK